MAGKAVTILWLRRRSRACGWEGGHEPVAGKAVTSLWLRRRSRACGWEGSHEAVAGKAVTRLWLGRRKVGNSGLARSVTQAWPPAGGLARSVTQAWPPAGGLARSVTQAWPPAGAPALSVTVHSHCTLLSFEHTNILHTLVAMGGTALVAACFTQVR